MKEELKEYIEYLQKRAKDLDDAGENSITYNVIIKELSYIINKSP